VDVFAKIAAGDMREKMDQAQDQRQHEDGDYEEMKERIPPRMIRQRLRLCFGHQGLLS
jgi:hypothetical protein